MLFRRKGPTAAERGLPAYTSWDEFEPDEVTEPDGDDAEAHHAELERHVPKDKLDAHLKEKS